MSLVQILEQYAVFIYSAVYRQFLFVIQGVTGGTDQTSGGCSLGQTIPI